jgi:hypothetical protein
MLLSQTSFLSPTSQTHFGEKPKAIFQISKILPNVSKQYLSSQQLTHTNSLSPLSHPLI